MNSSRIVGKRILAISKGFVSSPLRSVVTVPVGKSGVNAPEPPAKETPKSGKGAGVIDSQPDTPDAVNRQERIVTEGQKMSEEGGPPLPHDAPIEPGSKESRI